MKKNTTKDCTECTENRIKLDDYIMPVSTPAPTPKKKSMQYTFPSIDMLMPSDTEISENDTAACEKKACAIEDVLQARKLSAKVVGITRGVAVTCFELEMPQGIPIKKIESCAEDIARALACEGNMRIQAPIPGKRTVGLEVPNDKADTVHLRDIIASPEFQNSSSPLTLALGKDIAGNNTICHLEKLPHLLMAGMTDSGKSTCLHSMIVSLMYKSSPEDVRLILIDPKQVEFSVYKGMPHLLGANVITDTQQTIRALSWAINEMERRYMLFSACKVRNIAEYGKSEAVASGAEQKLPYIVIIVDELAYLMSGTDRKTLEERIMRLAQKARAAGIHMVLATQRPDVNVITGTIKANLPSRIAFVVKNRVDSRIILDENGAETLLGHGDMLYAPIGIADPHRVQGAYISDEEIAKVSEFVRANNTADFDEEFVSAITGK